MAGGGQDLGSATFRVTLDDSDLRNKLKTLKADIEALKVGPVKLNPDGTGTRSKTNTDDAAKKKDAAAEARRQSALQTLESKRFRIARQINQLEERGVNVDRLRSKLEKDRFSTGTKSSLAQLQAANQTTRQLSRQVALAKDLADKNKRAATAAKTTDTPATTAPAKEPRQPARGIDRSPLQGSVREVGSPAFGTRGARLGGASESITAKTDAQSRRARLNQQLNSLEASGVKTTKLRAQLGEATTAQAKRQFGSFNQIADSLEDSLRSERAKLKIQKDQTRELEKQDKEGRRLGRENKSPVRGGIGFAGSPIAKEIAARKQARLAKDLDAGAMERAANRKAKIADRIDYLSTGGRDQSVRSAAAPLKPNAAAKKAEQLRQVEFAKTQKELNRIAKDNAQPIGGTKRTKDSPAFKAAEEERTRLRIERRAKKISDRQDYFATGGRDKPTLRQMAVPSAGDPAARTRARQQAAADRKNAAADKQRKQEQGARLNSGLVGGAFPLMFGQGGFAAAGGAIGGTAGGGPLGFGLSLVGTFVGSQIDELNKRLGELGTALRSPIESLDVFIAQATLASSVQDKLAKTLVEGGQLGAAEQLIRTESARTVDPIVAEGIAANNEKFNRALSDTKDILGQLTAGPTSAFLAFLADLLNTVNNVPAANPNATPAQQLSTTKSNAASNKNNALKIAAQSFAINPFLGLGASVAALPTANANAGDERTAGSKEVLALETRLTKEKQAQKSLEAAALQAKGQGRKELADTLSAQAKLAAIQAELTAGESAIAQELARNKDGRKDDKDQQFANNQRKDLRERIKLQNQLVEAESAAAAASSVIAAKKAKDLQGFEGSARILRDKELDVQLARTKTKEAKSALDQSTPASRKVAADGLTVAKNNQLIAQIELERTLLSLQNDLNKSLASEAIIRKGIAQQITASIAQQEAALARGDAAANPGNSVLAARAGGAEGRAFLAQNNLGVDAARRAEADIQNQIKFEVDPNKIAELQSKLQTASQATKLAMVEAGTALANKAADAAASLQSARDGLRGALDGKRGLLESNINKLPLEQRVNLKQNALADVRRGVDTGILRPDIKVNNTASLLSNANFVRQVEAANKQIAAAEAQISALNANTEALRQGGAIAVTVISDGAGGWSSGGAERIAA
jgi:hypothetical protein